MTDLDHLPTLLTADEVAQVLRMSVRSVHRLRSWGGAPGALHAVRVGRRSVRYYRDSVQDYLDYLNKDSE